MTDTRERPAPPRAPETAPQPAKNPDVRRTLVAALAVALGMLTIKGLVRDSGWIVDAVLTVAVVAVPAALVRMRRRPGAFDVWIGVVLLVPWLTLRFVPDHAVLGLLPTPATFDDLSRLMSDLHRTTSDEPAPVVSTPAIRLVICALVGLVAALVDLIAVVGRRSALAGIPLLVVYTVSGAVARHAVPWGWFALAAVGFLLLLGVDTAGRREHWGHRVGGDDAGPPHVGRSGTAALLGVTAIAIAVLVPFLVPLPSHNVVADALRGGHGDGNIAQFGAGGGDGGSINPFAALRGQLNRGDPVTLATVHVDPGRDGKYPVPFYLRTNVLDEYTDAGWRVSDHGRADDLNSSSLDTAPSNDQPAADRISAEVTIRGLTSNPPVFNRLLAVNHVAEGTTWSPRDQLLLGRSLPRGTVVDETFDQPRPTTQDLQAARLSPSASVQRWLEKPQLPSTVVSLVDRLTSGKSSPYASARAINDYFTNGRNGFVYTLSTAAGDSGSALVDFLRNKEGFCQQYAAAEAIMLRQAGVPARVVLGYMHPAPDAQGNFDVTSSDAHSWVEAYFQGLGWIPFDPTPAAGLTGGSESDLPWASHNYPGSPSQGSSSAATSAAPTPTSGPTQSSAPTSQAPAANPDASADGSSSSLTAPLLAAALVVVVLALLLTPAGVRDARRRRRFAAARAGDADALWRELTDTALDLGYTWSPARSPRQVAEWLGGDLHDGSADDQRGALNRLATLVERHRYARTTPPAPGALNNLKIK